jgi:hypothetical protein
MRGMASQGSRKSRCFRAIQAEEKLNAAPAYRRGHVAKNQPHCNWATCELLHRLRRRMALIPYGCDASSMALPRASRLERYSRIMGGQRFGPGKLTTQPPQHRQLAARACECPLNVSDLQTGGGLKCKIHLAGSLEERESIPLLAKPPHCSFDAFSHIPFSPLPAKRAFFGAQPGGQPSVAQRRSVRQIIAPC